MFDSSYLTIFIFKREKTNPIKAALYLQKWFASVQKLTLKLLPAAQKYMRIWALSKCIVLTEMVCICAWSGPWHHHWLQHPELWPALSSEQGHTSQGKYADISTWLQCPELWRALSSEQGHTSQGKYMDSRTWLQQLELWPALPSTQRRTSQGKYADFTGLQRPELWPALPSAQSCTSESGYTDLITDCDIQNFDLTCHAVWTERHISR